MKATKSYCIEYFYAKENCKNQLLDALQTLVPLSKSETGCLQYDIILDEKNPNLIILIVQFSSKELMQQHEKKDYIQKFINGPMKEYCENFTWHDATGV